MTFMLYCKVATLLYYYLCFNLMSYLVILLFLCNDFVLCSVMLFSNIRLLFFNVPLFINIILLLFNVSMLFCILLSRFVTLYHCFVRYNDVLCIVMLFCNDETLLYILRYCVMSDYIIL